MVFLEKVMDLQKEIVYQEYINRENEVLHAPYDPELEFYSLVQLGDVSRVTELCSVSLLEKENLGQLSKNFLRHIKYHFVITTAMVARYCIEGGMETTTAYTLSDFYINKADVAGSAETISELHRIMCIDYTKRMQQLRKKKVCSRHVALALDYIYDNLHTKITVPVLANYVDLNPSYFSRLFKEETGQTVSDYIRNKKIDTAKQMLMYSDYSQIEISNILAFPSQSYFTEIFRKTTGVTPIKFRQMNLRKLNV